MIRPEILQEIRGRADILDVASRLGCRVRGDRITAAWRGGDGLTVSVDRGRGLFYDHKAQQGGDIFDLVKQLADCDFYQAAVWLAEFTGVPLQRQSTAQVKQRQRRLESAEQKARELVAWRDRLVQGLRGLRNRIWDDCTNLIRWAAVQPRFSEDRRWSELARISTRQSIADGIDAYVAAIESMSAAAVMQLRARLEESEGVA